MTENARTVYSTETGRICPRCGKPTPACSCMGGKSMSKGNKESDGIIRIRREKKGRKGKTVTAICGFDPSTDGLKQIAKNLKVKCGTGGSIKEGVIIVQGDHRQAIKAELQKQGYKVTLAGG